MHDGREALQEDSDSLPERVEATAAWVAGMKELVVVDELSWDDGWGDLRRIAVNYAIRRQFEGLEAAIALARADLGHLAVGFVPQEAEV
jgi:hypothetical protein